MTELTEREVTMIVSLINKRFIDDVMGVRFVTFVDRNIWQLSRADGLWAVTFGVDFEGIKIPYVCLGRYSNERTVMTILGNIEDIRSDLMFMKMASPC